MMYVCMYVCNKSLRKYQHKVKVTELDYDKSSSKTTHQRKIFPIKTLCNVRKKLSEQIQINP